MPRSPWGPDLPEGPRLVLPLPTPNLTPICRGWEGCELPGDPFPSGDGTLGQSCGDRELTAGLCTPQDATAGLHQEKPMRKEQGWLPEAERDPATVSPPSQHGAVWNGNALELKWVLHEGQPPRTVPGQGLARRDRWA